MAVQTSPQPTPGERQKRPRFWRFSIRQLLLWTAAVAVGCVALRSSSQLWISTMHAVALGSLALAILLVAYRRGPRRAYWFGFATCGWLYVGLLFLGWFLPDNRRSLVPLETDQLLTTWMSEQAYDYVYPYLAPRSFAGGPVSFSGGYGSAGMEDGMMGGEMGGMPGMGAGGFVAVRAPQHEFVNLTQALWTLLLAACGGSIARWLYLTRDPEPA